MMNLLHLIVDVGKETHLKNTLAHRLTLSNRRSRDGSHHLPIEIFHHRRSDINLINLV